MHLIALTLMLLCAALTAGYSITQPLPGSKLDLTQNNTITWTSESSDPDIFDIALINSDKHYFVTIGHALHKTDGEFNFQDVKADAGKNYQFKFEDFENAGQELTISGKFTVVSEGAATSSATAGAASTASADSQSGASMTRASSLLLGGLIGVQLLQWLA